MVSSVQEPSISSAIDRRGFLRSLGGGLLVLVATSDGALAQESGHQRRHESSDQIPQNLSAWLHISHDGAITAFTGKVEVGQNIRTSLTQAVADELNCAPGAVTLVMAIPISLPGTWGHSEAGPLRPWLLRCGEWLPLPGRN